MRAASPRIPRVRLVDFFVTTRPRVELDPEDVVDKS